MTYIKIKSADAEQDRCIAILTPMFVKYQDRNGILVKCSKDDAQGIISPEDNNTVYYLQGRDATGFNVDNLITASLSNLSEYEAYISQQTDKDIEDEFPQISDDTPEETVLTRAELTRRITELEEQNEFLQNCILEMSEIIYS